MEEQEIRRVTADIDSVLKKAKETLMSPQFEALANRTHVRIAMFQLMEGSGVNAEELGGLGIALMALGAAMAEEDIKLRSL